MKKKLVLVAGFALSMSLLAGCSFGAPSVEKLVDGMYENKYDSATAEVAMAADVSVKASGVSVDVSGNVDMTMEMSGLKGDEPAYHMSGTVKYDALGQNDKLKFEMYSITEDEEVTVYGYTDVTDQWVYNTTEVDDSVVDEDFIEEVQNAAKEIWYNATLEKGTEEINGIKCYVLTLDTTGADYMDMMNLILKQADAEDAFDTLEDAGIDINKVMKNINVTYTCYIAKKGGYQVGIVADMSGTNAMKIAEMISDAMGSELPIEEIAISELSFSMYLSDVDSADEVEVPKSVKNDAVESSSSVSDFDFVDTDYDFGDDDAVVDDDYDWDDDDYDWDDDDYDWGDDDDDYGWDDDYDYSSDSDSWLSGSGPIYVDSFDLTEYWGYDNLCTVNVPNGFGVYPEYSSLNDYYDIISDDGATDFYVQNYIPNAVQEYYETGSYDTSSYDSYDIEVIDLGFKYMGSDVVVLKTEYAYTGSSTSTKNYVVFAYTDYYGDTRYAGIEFYAGDDDYSASDYADLFNAVFR